MSRSDKKRIFIDPRFDTSSDRWEGHWYYCGQVNGKAQFRSIFDGEWLP